MREDIYEDFHWIEIIQFNIIDIVTGVKSNKNNQYLSFISLFDKTVSFKLTNKDNIDLNQYNRSGSI